MKPSRVVRMFVGLLGFAAALTVLFLAMRAVMNVGGFCAEGGPYQIAVRCPENAAVLTPLSILSLFVFGGLYLASLVKNGPNFTGFFWCGLFLALGWNFFEYAFNPPGESGFVISWFICGVLFVLMGGGPLLLIGRRKLGMVLLGSTVNPHTREESVFPLGVPRAFLVALHAIAIASGIVAGFFIYRVAAF